MSFSFLSAVRRFPVFLPLAKLAAAALVATAIAGPTMAAKDWGPSACTPEPGDKRVTRWTSQIDCAGKDCTLTLADNHLIHNQISVLATVLANSDFGGLYTKADFPNDRRTVYVAVIGNDAKAGTVVQGQWVGDISDTQHASNRVTFDGLKPNAHYVAVLYAPYLGSGNLNPFVRYCFRTARDPSNPWGGSASGCFQPYAGGYAACNAARTECNNQNGSWDDVHLRCIEDSN